MSTLASHRPLRHNLASNFAASVASGLTGLVAAPILFTRLGAESYGLVGIFLVAQSLMPIVDAGITPGFGRAVAWCRGHGGDPGEILTIFRSFERLLLIVAALAATTAAVLSHWADHWLHVQSLAPATVRASVALMAIALALRLVAGLSRAGLMAIEHQAEANAIFVTMTVLRNFGALAFALATGSGILGFFMAQMPVAIAELFAYRLRFRRLLPAIAVPVKQGEMRRHALFATGMGGLVLLWLVTSQIDKVALSATLPLPQYGDYSLGVHLASAVMLAAAAIQQTVQPRLTRLVGSQEDGQARQLYRLATALMACIAGSLAVGVTFGGAALLSLMRPGTTPDLAITGWYAIANAAIAVNSTAYMLQVAKGQLRLHAIGSVVLAVVQVPLLLVVAASGNARATAMCYALPQIVYLLSWLPVVHRRMLGDGYLRWLVADVVTPLMPALAAALVLSRLAQSATLANLLLCATVTTAAMAAACWLHAGLRGSLQAYARGLRA